MCWCDKMFMHSQECYFGVYFLSYNASKGNKHQINKHSLEQINSRALLPIYHSPWLLRIILCMCPADRRWCYIVSSSLIGWVHIQNDPWAFGSMPNKKLTDALSSDITVWLNATHKENFKCYIIFHIFLYERQTLETSIKLSMSANYWRKMWHF